MIPKLKITVFVLIILLLSQLPVLAFEKVGTTSFQFLKVMTDARSTGMGEAYCAVANNSEAVFWNPAALTRVQHFDASISYLDYFLDVKHSSFSAAYTFRNIGTFGLQGLVTDVGEIKVTRVSDLGFRGETFNPGLTGETISPSAMAFGLSFARRLTDKFAFGLTAKYVKEDLVVKSANAIVFDGGLTYNTGFRSLEVAASVRHFGKEIKYFEEGYPLPQTFNIGVAAYLISSGENFLMTSESQSLLVAFDLVQPRDYAQQYNVGLEYTWQNAIILRGGYKINYDEEGLCLGMGLKYDKFRFDYSYNDFGSYLGSVHRFTFGFSLR